MKTFKKKIPKKKIFPHFLNVITIALIIESFLCSFLAIRLYAKADCRDRIEETTKQMAGMLNDSMNETQKKLTVFAGILGANSQNPEELLKVYMENFCKTQDFSGLCIHRADGTIISHGTHFHDAMDVLAFEEEVKNLPYISEIYSNGELAEEKFFYQAVPIIRNEAIVAILYGYMSLDVLPNYVQCTAYDGACQLYIVDGDSGDFLMDTWHGGSLGNIDSMGERETKKGYDIEAMREDVKNGNSGYFVFRSRTTGEWFYTYYMPTEINNWSIQLTIDEPTAFASYNDVNEAVFILGICVIVMMFVHVSVLMFQNARIRGNDLMVLHKSNYMYEVQKMLLGAQDNSYSILQALEIVANEMKAETALLLSFSEEQVLNTYYWPPQDGLQIKKLLSRNIKQDFPMIYERFIQNESVTYDVKNSSETLSGSAKRIFEDLEISNIMLVPIVDNDGFLKGTICAVNMETMRDTEMLECVTYDFFMAMRNVENHTIIKDMGTMDYLTKVKNRNSYESELGRYVGMSCENLWSVFIDVNGLHEVNNTKGHKAGDKMLCAVADAVKKMFGINYTYRLGGDEFLAFACDSSYEELTRKKEILVAQLASQGYHISLGFECAIKNGQGLFDVEKSVADAEAIMYHDKWEYYEKNDILSDRTHYPSLRGGGGPSWMDNWHEYKELVRLKDTMLRIGV